MMPKKIVSVVGLGLVAMGLVASNPLQTSADAAAMAQQVKWPAHFVYMFEAYDQGRLVAQERWETDALNETQLLQLMAGAQAGFAQRLKDRGIDWNSIHPILIDVRPLN